tara:strand:- start:31 stop:426 length:396 start_codon:yes stop_codon:yes gene_type:complete
MYPWREQEKAERKELGDNVWLFMVWHKGQIVRIDTFDTHDEAIDMSVTRAGHRYGLEWLRANLKSPVEEKESNTFVAGDETDGYSIARPSQLPRSKLISPKQLNASAYALEELRDKYEQSRFLDGQNRLST